MTLPTPQVPVSWGELLDKLVILAIKRDRIADPAKLANVAHEHDALAIVAAPALAMAAVAPLLADLRRINLALWRIEDAIREREAEHRFDADFIALARAVYRTNDERAAVKRAINAALGSEMVEEKSYGGAVSPAAR